MTWQPANAGVKYSFTSQNVVRYYYYRITARNVLYTAVSDYILVYFTCPSDNTGVTINKPTGEFYFKALQKTASSTTAIIDFIQWTNTEIYTGCGFFYYGISSDPSFSSDLALVAYPNPDRTVNVYFPTCYYLLDKCREIKLLNTGIARNI